MRGLIVGVVAMAVLAGCNGAANRGATSPGDDPRLAQRAAMALTGAQGCPAPNAVFPSEGMYVLKEPLSWSSGKVAGPGGAMIPYLSASAPLAGDRGMIRIVVGKVGDPGGAPDKIGLPAPLMGGAAPAGMAVSVCDDGCVTTVSLRHGFMDVLVDPDEPQPLQQPVDGRVKPMRVPVRLVIKGPSRPTSVYAGRYAARFVTLALPDVGATAGRESFFRPAQRPNQCADAAIKDGTPQQVLVEADDHRLVAIDEVGVVDISRNFQPNGVLPKPRSLFPGAEELFLEQVCEFVAAVRANAGEAANAPDCLP